MDHYIKVTELYEVVRKLKGCRKYRLIFMENKLTGSWISAFFPCPSFTRKKFKKKLTAMFIMLNDHHHQKGGGRGGSVCRSLRKKSTQTATILQTVIKHYSDLNFTCIKSPVSESWDGLVNLRSIAEPGKR